MSLAGCEINQIYVNFHLKKGLEIFDKNLANKIWSKFSGIILIWFMVICRKK